MQEANVVVQYVNGRTECYPLLTDETGVYVSHAGPSCKTLLINPAGTVREGARGYPVGLLVCAAKERELWIKEHPPSKPICEGWVLKENPNSPGCWIGYGPDEMEVCYMPETNRIAIEGERGQKWHSAPVEVIWAVIAANKG